MKKKPKAQKKQAKRSVVRDLPAKKAATVKGGLREQGLGRSYIK